MLDIAYAIALDESGRVIFAGSTDNLQQGGSDFLVGRLAWMAAIWTRRFMARVSQSSNLTRAM